MRSPGQGGVGVVGFLELRGAKQLFDVLDRVLERYQSGRHKHVEDAFLLVFGLVHMREWIAPGYKGGTPKSTAERFSKALFDQPAYDVLRRFANQSKHQQIPGDALPIMQGAHYAAIDDADSVDALVDFDSGPPNVYSIEGTEAGVLFAQVLSFYRQHWFTLPLDERLR